MTTTTTAAGTTAGVVPDGSGRTYFEGPLGAVLLAGAQQTGGVAAFLIHPLAPRALGSPVHTHRHEDEWSFVLEGEVGVQLGDEVQVARTGDLVLKPRDVPTPSGTPATVRRGSSRSSHPADSRATSSGWARSWQ